MNDVHTSVKTPASRATFWATSWASGWVAKTLAWCVHLYTALGLLAAAGIAVLLVQGTPAAFRGALFLMAVALFIDGTDGTLARRLRVKEVLPGFDGRRLDDLIDFLTYTCLPLLLIWRAEVLPEGWAWFLLAPLLASAYGFSQTAAKTDDGHFLGFPSYWNVAALYLYVLRPPGWASVLLLLAFAFLTFVPSRYLYPSQRGTGRRLLNAVTNLLGLVWACLVVMVLWRLPVDNTPIDALTFWLAIASLFFPAYYMIASWCISLRITGRRGAGALPLTNDRILR